MEGNAEERPNDELDFRADPRGTSSSNRVRPGAPGAFLLARLPCSLAHPLINTSRGIQACCTDQQQTHQILADLRHQNQVQQLQPEGRRQEGESILNSWQKGTSFGLAAQPDPVKSCNANG